MRPHQRNLLRCAVAAPIFYFGTVLVASMFFPGYSHVRQYASELGSLEAAFPGIFNGGIALTGLAIVAAAIGFFLAALRISGRRHWSAAAGVTLGLFGVALLIGAAFPMPDPRHNAFGLGVTIHLAPFLLAAALRGQEEFRGLNRFLWMAGLVMTGMFLVSMGVGSLVRRSNVGVVQRVYALTVFVWIAVAGAKLLRWDGWLPEPAVQPAAGQPA